MAEPAAEIVPRGMLGPGLIAKILVDKYCDHIPFHRQEDQMARQGVTVDRATMKAGPDFAQERDFVISSIPVEQKSTGC